MKVNNAKATEYLSKEHRNIGRPTSSAFINGFFVQSSEMSWSCTEDTTCSSTPSTGWFESTVTYKKRQIISAWPSPTLTLSNKTCERQLCSEDSSWNTDAAVICTDIPFQTSLYNQQMCWGVFHAETTCKCSVTCNRVTGKPGKLENHINIGENSQIWFLKIWKSHGKLRETSGSQKNCIGWTSLLGPNSSLI